MTTCKFQEFGKVVFCHTKFLQAYLENNNMLKMSLFINTVIQHGQQTKLFLQH